MTALDHPTHAIHAPTRVGLAVARVATGLRAFLRAVLNRNEVTRLHHLSDHELADIGLTRTDLAVAMRAPLGVDPTTELAALASGRITAERGARRDW